MKAKRFLCRVYRFYWHVLITPDADEAGRYIARRGEIGATMDDEPFSGYFTWLDTKDDRREYVIILEEWTQRTTDISTLSHELNHLCFELFRERGITLTKGSEEAFTYLQDSLLEEALEWANTLPA